MVYHSLSSYACPDARKDHTLFQFEYAKALSHRIVKNSNLFQERSRQP